jgi:hypothetical protein
MDIENVVTVVQASFFVFLIMICGKEGKAQKQK